MTEKAPHPSPLPEGEGTDWGIFENYADVKLLYRIHSRLDISSRCTSREQLSQSPLQQGEGTDWGMLEKYADVKLLCRIHNR
ncbi:hypothetical protein PkoCFBP13504_08070 [Pseudomonas koreensis]|nr:hypothetical protein PkoCFBP13504_08070 [Pseudomonas koreensis]